MGLRREFSPFLLSNSKLSCLTLRTLSMWTLHAVLSTTGSSDMATARPCHGLWPKVLEELGIAVMPQL